MNNRVVWIGLIVGLLIGVLFLAPVSEKVTATTDAAVGHNTGTNIAIADGLGGASGEQTVVVRLTERPTRAIQAASHDSPTDVLQAHAATTQSAFERFASGNPHVTINRQLWLTNAVVVTVDTDRVPLARLGAVDHVEQIHENYRVSTSATTETVHSNQDPVTPFSTPTARSQLPTTQPPPTTQSTTLTAVDGTATTTATTEPQFTNGLKLIDVPTAWERFENRGDGVRVAVLDTGVNPNHPDIDIKDSNWKCYTDCHTDGPHDVDGHGTHVSGTVVGGNANDANLQIGVAPNATLMNAKVLDNTGQGTYADLIEGMEWAVSNDADVISFSLGVSGYNDAFINPVRNAQASGTTIVAAVGNNGEGTSGSPGNIYDATSVGAVNVQPGYPERYNPDLTNDTVWEESGGEAIDSADWEEIYNDTPDDWPDSYVVPDVTAPGNIIWSADTNINTRTVSNVDTTDLTLLRGTSMATPHVAGVVALIQSNSAIDRSPSELRSALENTAVDIDARSTRQGVGRIDADDAVAELATNTATTNITSTITAAPDRVTAGQTLTVDYTATNRGSDPGATTVELLLNGRVVETTDTGTIAPGEQAVGTLTYRTTSDDIGPQTITLSSTDSIDTRTVRIVEPQVRLTNVSITSTQVSDTATTYTLTATMLNISDDGHPDTVRMAMPQQIVVDEVTTTTAVDTAGVSIAVTNATATDDEITMAISPDSDAALRDVTVTTEFTAHRTTG